jgi:hypothetical protein
MRKVFYGLGVIFAIIIVAGAGGLFLLSHNGAALDRTSKAYVHDSVVAIAANWDAKELWTRAAPELRNVANENEVRGLFDAAKGALGPLIEYRGSKGEATIWFDHSKTVISAKYVAQCRFEKGNATVQIVLLKQDGKWMIEGFHINSTAVMHRLVGITS